MLNILKVTTVNTRVDTEKVGCQLQNDAVTL